MNFSRNENREACQFIQPAFFFIYTVVEIGQRRPVEASLVYGRVFFRSGILLCPFCFCFARRFTPAGRPGSANSQECRKH